MEDTPLQGMARSIDALFSDVEQREEPADAAEESAPGDAVEEDAADPSPASSKGGVEASVASADLLDDVEVIAPRSERERPAASRPVTLDEDEDEDPAALAEAASWPAHRRAPEKQADPDPSAFPETPTAPAAPAGSEISTDAGVPAGSGTSADAVTPVGADRPIDVEVSADAATPVVADGPADAETPADAGGPTAAADTPAGSDAPMGAGPPAIPDLPASDARADAAASAMPDSPGPTLEPLRPEPAGPDDVALRARAMAVAVDAYLEAQPRRREAAADQVREAVAAHREARELNAVADAVERLARAGDRAAVALAREVAAPAVASQLVGRLGIARDEDRRAELFEVAERLGSVMAPAVADALSGAEDRSARRNYVEALVRLGEPGLREAEAMVEDPRWFVVRNGVAILGEMGGARAVEHLTSTLAHGDPRVRRETLMGLARIGGDDASMLVAGKLEDPDPEVRAAAAMAVGALRVERAQRPLQALLEGEDDTDVLVQTLRALGQLGDPGAVVAIEKKAVGSFFSRPPTSVRVAAYRALAAIGTPHARAVIEGATEDKDPEVRQVARGLLAAR